MTVRWKHRRRWATMELKTRLHCTQICEVIPRPTTPKLFKIEVIDQKKTCLILKIKMRDGIRWKKCMPWNRLARVQTISDPQSTIIEAFTCPGWPAQKDPPCHEQKTCSVWVHRRKIVHICQLWVLEARLFRADIWATHLALTGVSKSSMCRMIWAKNGKLKAKWELLSKSSKRSQYCSSKKLSLTNWKTNTISKKV